MDDRFDEIVSDAARDLWERDHPFSGAEKDVLLERAKQRAKWGDDHDDKHADGALAMSAACLAHPDGEYVRAYWWGHKLLRKHANDRRRQLVIAAALCIAEIERLDRAEVPRG